MDYHTICSLSTAWSNWYLQSLAVFHELERGNVTLEEIDEYRAKMCIKIEESNAEHFLQDLTAYASMPWDTQKPLTIVLDDDMRLSPLTFNT